MKLRPYQIKATRRALKASDEAKVLVVSPGGSGKTAMIASLVRRLKWAGKRVLVVAHRREIIDQCYAHIRAFKISEASIGVIMGGDTRVNPGARIQLASVATMRWREKPEADVVIVDEAHHIVAPTYMALLEAYPDAKVFGFTATPYRLDSKGLGDVFEVLINAAKPSYLIKNNWMAKPRIITAPDQFLPNLDSLTIKYGEYVTMELETRVAQEPLIGNIVDHWCEHAEGRTTLVFAVSIHHSERIVARFRDRGIEAAHLDGSTSTSRRRAMLRKLASGEIKVLSSCMLLSEGYDLPHCDAVVLARPTKSLALSQQQAGRAMRYNAGISPIILDHARHYLMFGLPYADRDYNLLDTQEAASGKAPAKACPVCGAVHHTAAKYCDCGHEFSDDERESPGETEDHLDELTSRKFDEMKERLVEYAKLHYIDRAWVDMVSKQWLSQHA